MWSPTQSGQLRVFGLPAGQPGGQISACLVDVALVVQPAQLLQAVIVRSARDVAECVAQEMHVAPLPP